MRYNNKKPYLCTQFNQNNYDIYIIFRPRTFSGPPQWT